MTKRKITAAAGCAAITICVSAAGGLPASRAGATAGTIPAATIPAGTIPAGHLAAAAARTVVSFTFDDGDADQMAAARVLHTYGMDGTFYVITGAVGQPKYVTLADLRTLAADGDEIGGHTVSHLELPRVSPAEARRQVCDGRDTLLRWGFRVTSFAYPGGVYSPATEAIVRECGFNSARIVVGLRSPGCRACAVAETMPPGDPYAIRVPGQVDGTWTLATLEQLVSYAEQNGGGWLPLVFHHICVTGTCAPLTVRLSLVRAFAAWLAAQRAAGPVVETVHDAIGGPLRPMVAAAAAGRHGVINPVFRTLGTPGGVNPINEAPTREAAFPLCWMKADYGQNTVTWQRIRGGHRSQWAVRLTMLSHSSGAADLIQQFDTGQCSVPVTGGQSYNLATWYKSTIATQFSAYYRTPAGRWLYWTSSPFYPAGRAWAEAAWTTPPVPAGASGLSFGLALDSRGSLSTDDYSIQATPPSTIRGILDVAVLVLVVGGGAVATARAVRRRRRRRRPADGLSQSGAAGTG